MFYYSFSVKGSVSSPLAFENGATPADELFCPAMEIERCFISRATVTELAVNSRLWWTTGHRSAGAAGSRFAWVLKGFAAL